MAKATTKKQDAAENGSAEKEQAETKPTGEIRKTRSPRVFAAVCERNPNHQSTRIYKTKGRTRYCVCDDCGHTWKQVGEPADPLGEYCRELATQLEALTEEAQAAKDDTVILNLNEVLGIVEDVRLLLG